MLAGRSRATVAASLTKIHLLVQIDLTIPKSKRNAAPNDKIMRSTHRRDVHRRVVHRRLFGAHILLVLLLLVLLVLELSHDCVQLCGVA